MPDKPTGKQRWREVPPPTENDRWTVDSAQAGADRKSPPPLPPLPQRRESANSVRRQRAAPQAKQVGTNTMLAAALAIGAIALIVVLTMYLAKQN